MTLYRYCKKLKESANPSTSNAAKHVSAGYARPRQIFTDAEEQELVQYLLESSKMFYGLSPRETRKLAYQFAAKLKSTLPENWTEIPRQVKTGFRDSCIAMSVFCQSERHRRHRRHFLIVRPVSIGQTLIGFMTIWRTCTGVTILSRTEYGMLMKLG